MRLPRRCVGLLLACAALGDSLEGPDCAVLFPPAARAKAERILETFGSRREHAARWLGVESRGRADIRLVADHAELGALVPGAPSWAVAVTSGRLVALRLDLVDKDPAMALDIVLKHETVHFVLGRTRLPHWFEEGLAVQHAGVAYLESDAPLERLAAAGRLPTFAEADRLFEGGKGEAAIGYKLAGRVVAEFVRRFGDDAVARLVRAVATGEAFPDAFAAATGERLADFERSWRAEVTPSLPLWLFVVAQNLDLALLFAAAILAALGYLRWRLRRERAMAGLGVGGEERDP